MTKHVIYSNHAILIIGTKIYLDVIIDIYLTTIFIGLLLKFIFWYLTQK